MRRKLLRLARDGRGAAAVEFGILAPVLILMIVGIAQFGILFMANAGLRHAVGEAARHATIYPRPSDEQILAVLQDRRFGLDAARLGTPRITHGVSDGANYAEIELSYSVPLDFIFFTGPEVTLTETRRAFVHQAT